MDCFKVPLIQQNNSININGTIEKKVFSNLEISSSISTLEINSSYENINDITYNKYIANNDLRNETIKFLKEKCQLIQNKFIHNYNIIQNKNKDSTLININSKVYSKSSLMNTISKTPTRRMNLKKDDSTILSRKSFLNKSINNDNRNDAINDFQQLITQSFYNKKMDMNNSMTLNKSKSKSSKKNSNQDEGDILMSMVIKPNSETKTKIAKTQNFKIICKNNPKKIFQTISDELLIHIISCNYCQKELLLFQARQLKLENQLLNDKKEALEMKKRRRRKDVNDTMTDIDLNEDSYDNEEDYEGEDYNEEYDEEEEYDEYDEEGDNNTSMIGGLNDNPNNKKKNKSKGDRKDNDREKIIESENEENSNDEDDIENYFLNVRKKKKEEKLTPLLNQSLKQVKHL